MLTIINKGVLDFHLTSLLINNCLLGKVTLRIMHRVVIGNKRNLDLVFNNSRILCLMHSLRATM